MLTTQQIVEQTEKWIQDVVVACNFCPFAAQVIRQKKVHYEVETSNQLDSCLEAVLRELNRLENESTIETTFLIFPDAFKEFDDFLDLVSLAEDLLEQSGFDGIYQLASFHPLYLFANSSKTDPANYTNRSIYPMLHLLCESSIDRALENYKHPENIPDTNINFAREKGLAAMQQLRDSCLTRTLG